MSQEPNQPTTSDLREKELKQRTEAAHSGMIDMTTNANVEVNRFNLAIEADSLKYTEWMAAISTASIGVAVTQYKVILNSPPLIGTPLAFWVLLASGTCLGISTIIAGVVFWRRNERMGQLRQLMTLVLQHRIECAVESQPPPPVPKATHPILWPLQEKTVRLQLGRFAQSLLNCEFLSGDSKKEYDRLYNICLSNDRLLPVAQQVLLIVGILLFFVAAIPRGP
jgi:hypothetical protein